jgi:hypothetical protein
MKLFIALIALLNSLNALSVGDKVEDVVGGTVGGTVDAVGFILDSAFFFIKPENKFKHVLINVKMLNDSDKFNQLNDYHTDELSEDEIDDLEKPVAIDKLEKGEFEKVRDFRDRVSAVSLEHLRYKHKIDLIKAKHQEEVIPKALNTIYGIPILRDIEYHADMELFIGKLDFDEKKLNQLGLVHVPQEQAS